jgi:hypothetical protein
VRRIPLLVRKDLLRKLRSPLGVAVALAFPVVFSAILAVAFSGNALPRAVILVENLDEGFLGNALISALDSNESAKYFDVEVVGPEGAERIGHGEGSALLRIPKNFTLDLIDGTPTSLELIRNPAQGIMPEVAEQATGVLVDVLDTGSHVLRPPLDAIAPFARDDRLRITDQTVAAVAVAVKGTIEGASDYLDPVVIKFESVDLGAPPAAESEDEADDDAQAPYFSLFLLVFPGASVYALFMVGDVAMRDILTEFDAGTLRRQLQGPLRAGTLVVAKMLFTAVLCLLSLVILTVIGAIAADRPVDFVAYAALSLGLILAITGAGAAIYGASGSEKRGSTIAAVLYLVLAFAGGTFIDVRLLPRPVQAIAPASPLYWGTTGYRTLLDGGSLADVGAAIAVLCGIGAGLGFLGAALMKRRIMRGAA